MTTIAQLLPEIDRHLQAVLDHAMYHDTGALNATEIACLKDDVKHLAIAINILSRWLRDQERETQLISRLEEIVNYKGGDLP